MKRTRWAIATATLLLTTALVGCGDQSSGGSDDPAAADGTDGTYGTDATDRLPEPDDGFGWVSWRDVAVQVPTAWGHAYEPGGDWCAGYDPDDDPPVPEPYYDLDPASGAELAIGCQETGEDRPEEFGPAPEALWATHVVLEPDDGSEDRTLTDGGWTLAIRSVGDVRVRALAAQGDADLVDQIVASARRFSVDHNGCEPTSPVQAAEFVRPEPHDITGVGEADSISVCQYSRTLGPADPALMGSWRAEGADAAALLAGLQGAPPGTGPDRPKNCVDDYFGDTAITLRVHVGDETHEVYAYYDWCFGNGTDDGVQRRELTSETCAPLFVGPVRIVQYSSHLRGICDSA